MAKKQKAAPKDKAKAKTKIVARASPMKKKSSADDDIIKTPIDCAAMCSTFGSLDANLKYAVSRHLRCRFGHISTERLKMSVNKSGLNIVEVLVDKVILASKQHAYIKNEWWTELERDFNLGTEVFDQLEPPPVEANEPEPDEELATIMCKALNDNQTERPEGMRQLDRYMTDSGALCLSQVHALLEQSKPSTTMKQRQSQDLRWLTLRHMTKHGVAKRWPDGWNVVEHGLQCSMIKFWYLHAILAF